MNYIISYPRSGNTLVRAITEYITGQPTNGLCGKPNKSDRLQQPIIHKDSKDYIAHKRHDFNGVTDEDTVIFILRDYKEAIIRHNEAPRGLPTIEQFESYTAGTKGDYIGLLKAYDVFKGEKQLIRYENLKDRLTSPVFYLNEGIISPGFGSLIEAREIARNIYPDPQSKSKDHHKNKLTKEQRVQWDNSLRERHNQLFDKYLSKYAED